MLTKLLIIVVMLVSIGFCAIAQMRYLTYARKYKLPESKYTLLFGFMGLKHVDLLYVFAVFAHAVICLWIAFYYL